MPDSLYDQQLRQDMMSGRIHGSNLGISNWLFGGDATKKMPNGPQTGDFQRGYLQNGILTQQAPQMNTGQSDQVRGQQGELASMLMGQATGTQAGPGELAVQRGVNNAMSNQTATAQMARGANTALAMRNAARANADIGVNGAGQAGIAQMQDKMNAANQLSSLLGTQRSQDITTAGANQNAQLSQQQLQLGALAQMLGVDQSQLQAQLAKAQVAQGDKGMLGSLLQIGGQIGAAYAGAKH